MSAALTCATGLFRVELVSMTALMGGLAALLSGLLGLVRGELMGIAALMGGLAAFARDPALLLGVHRREAAVAAIVVVVRHVEY